MDTTKTEKNSILPIVAFTLVAFLFGILGIRFLGFLTRDHQSTDQERSAVRMETRKQLDEEDASLLAATEWVDQEKGIARIPIERAMELAVAELKSKPVAASSVAIPVPVAETPVTPTEGEAAPATETPESPASESPASESPASEPPASEPPASEPPASEPPTEEATP